MPARRDEAERKEQAGVRTRVLSAMAAGAAGLRYISELTAREVEGATRVQAVENGWMVDVEVVEDRRIPSSGDILALYQAELDREEI
ncbi:gas vesicle protein GvpO [Nonomuraea antimicrobica]